MVSHRKESDETNEDAFVLTRLNRFADLDDEESHDPEEADDNNLQPVEELKSNVIRKLDRRSVIDLQKEAKKLQEGIKEKKRSLASLRSSISSTTINMQRQKDELAESLRKIHTDKDNFKARMRATEESLHKARVTLDRLLESGEIKELELKVISLNEEQHRLTQIKADKRHAAQAKLDEIRRKLRRYGGKTVAGNSEEVRSLMIHLTEVMHKLSLSIGQDQTKIVDDPTLCLKCKTNKKNVLLLSCNHIPYCQGCSELWNTCCICSKSFRKTVVVFS